jgi:phage-related protein
MTPAKRKPLHFVSGSLKDLRGMPEEVQDVFGSALLDAQYGDHPAGARPFGEGLPRAIMKLVEDYDGDTFRVGYTVSFSKAVYVLHVFMKKSSSGRSTPNLDKNVLRARLHLAEQHYRSHYGGE